MDHRTQRLQSRSPGPSGAKATPEGPASAETSSGTALATALVPQTAGLGVRTVTVDEISPSVVYASRPPTGGHLSAAMMKPP